MNKLTKILAILTIMSLALGILGWNNLPDVWKTVGDTVGDNKPSFKVELSPKIIYQGQHSYDNPLKFELKIIPDGKQNITSIKIKKDNFEIIRDVTGEKLTVIWGYGYEDYIFDSSRNSFYDKISKSFEVFGCNNCFIGDNRDYTLRMIIEYSLNGIQQSPEVIELTIDVI